MTAGCPRCAALAEQVTREIGARDYHRRMRDEARRDLAQARQALRGLDFTREITLLRRRAAQGRAVSFDCDFYDLPLTVQNALYGIAGELEEIADSLAREALVERGTEQTDLGGARGARAQEGQTLVTNSALPESHFVREMAIALAASDALAGEDSSTVENAVTWARRLFASAEAAPVHDGDCVNACATCVLCFVQQFVDEARERSGLDEERVFSIGEPPPGTTTDAEQPSPESSPVSLSVQEGQGET